MKKLLIGLMLLAGGQFSQGYGQTVPNISTTPSPFNGSGQVPYATIYSAIPNNPGVGAAPGDVVTPTGGTTVQLAGYLATAKFVVTDTLISVIPTIVSPGSTCTNGAQTLTGTTGTGTKFQVSATVSGNAVDSVDSIVVAGVYSVNPTSLAVEPVTGAGCTGVTLNLSNSMGVAALYIQQSGSYSSLPSLTANPQASTTGSGTGLTLNLVALSLAAAIAPDPQFTGDFGGNSENFRAGYKSLSSCTTCVESLGIGWNTGGALITASSFVGIQCGVLLTAATNVTCMGTDAIRNGLSINNSVVMGSSALKDYASASNIGGMSLYGSGAGQHFTGTGSNPNWVAVGVNACQGAAAGATGNLNICIGPNTGTKMTSAGQAVIIGPNVASTTLTNGGRIILLGVASNCDTPTNSTTDYFAVCASTGSTPLLTGSMVAASLSLTSNGGLTLAAGQLNVTSMTQTAVAQSGTVCYNSGTGAVTYDATLGCLASTLAVKNNWHDIKPDDALAIVTRMHPGSFTYKADLGLPAGEQIGFAAEQIGEIDDRLIGHRLDGSVAGVRYQQSSALYAGAIKALQDRIIELENRLK